MNKTKLLGQTFTEQTEVIKMLSMYSKEIIDSKILEPSFGDGMFLMDIIRKIVNEGFNNGVSKKDLVNILNDNIYGYELDPHFFVICKNNLNSVLEEMGFENFPKWVNLHNDSIFELREGDFDLIIGNPPYVRVQNFDKGSHGIKKELARTHGNTDLFLMFIDFLLSKLNKKGELIFIVPNSLGKSRAAKELRDFMFKSGEINYIDFESRQLFAKASVYSCIFRFLNNGDPAKSSFRYDYKGRKYKLKNVGFYTNKKPLIIKDDLMVKNGLATLADPIFIRKRDSEDFKNFENKYIYDLYKASRMKEQFKIIFPYKVIDGKIIRFDSFKELKNEAPNIARYLMSNKKSLEKRSLETKTKWFEYGRSQAIKDISKKKYMIDTLIKPGQKLLTIKDLPKNTLVFSGLYSTSDKIKGMNNADLINSFRANAKDMRGGYKKISSSLLKNDK